MERASASAQIPAPLDDYRGIFQSGMATALTDRWKRVLARTPETPGPFSWEIHPSNDKQYRCERVQQGETELQVRADSRWDRYRVSAECPWSQKSGPLPG